MVLWRMINRTLLWYYYVFLCYCKNRIVRMLWLRWHTYRGFSTRFSPLSRGHSSTTNMLFVWWNSVRNIEIIFLTELLHLPYSSNLLPQDFCRFQLLRIFLGNIRLTSKDVCLNSLSRIFIRDVKMSTATRTNYA